MASTLGLSPSAEIRSRLDHPIIDSDGHLIEFQPVFLEFLKDIGGADMANRFAEGNVNRLSKNWAKDWYEATPEERARKRPTRPGWWAVPSKNTLDRVTASLPRLLYERLDEIGLDFTVLYPTVTASYLHHADEEFRRATCRAFNKCHSTIYKEYGDRMTPVAAIPMHTPAEAIEELEYAVNELGMKAVLMAAYVLRPHAEGQGYWYDALCLDSAYDYDPVWAKCLELKVAPTFHSSTHGLGTRTSISNYMYNHIGHFAASGEALCKAAFMGGVTRRFPELRMAFLEGGVGWGCSLYSDLIARWKKRNRKALENYNPANLDRDLFWDLHRRYGGELVKGRLDDQRGRNLALYAGNPGLGPMPGNPPPVDDFERCGIKRPEDIRDLFVNNFYFGCEADDSINAWAFDTKKNPYGAKLRAIFSSDIGHWDVPEMRIVAAEAHELVEDGVITEEDFRDFVFANPMKLWTDTNPDFFKGTVIEPYIDKRSA